MVLTGKSIVEKKIISNISDDSVQQQGVDLRLNRVFSVGDPWQYSYREGVIPKKGKTTLPNRREILLDNEPNEFGNDEVDELFTLKPGYYEIELMESCDIPKNAVMWIKGRSSVVRCGGRIDSGQFDGGFHTDKMGCFLEVIRPMFIERGARIAQAVVFESEPVDDEYLYNGQYQGK